MKPSEPKGLPVDTWLREACPNTDRTVKLIGNWKTRGLSLEAVAPLYLMTYQLS